MRSFVTNLLTRHRIDSKILMIFLALAAALFVFFQIAEEVAEGDSFRLDRWVMQSLRNASDPSIPAGPGWLQETMIDITALGGVSVLTLVTALVAGYLASARRLHTALFVIGAVSLGAILSEVLKMGFARDRPDLVAHLVDVDTSSFPSAHAMNSAVVYLTLAALMARTLKDWPTRIYILSAGIFLTLIIGFSRVYLGVHWPSDVVAGWCVGGAWAALCSIVARFLQRRDQIESPAAAIADPDSMAGDARLRS
jgi:undecaprenyl-diphosphatase